MAREPSIACPVEEQPGAGRRPQGSISGEGSDASSSDAVSRDAAPAAPKLLGSPALSFRRRFNMTFSTASAHSSWLVIAAILAVLLRRPRGPPLLRLAMVLEVALMGCDLVWRRRCRRALDGGSHAAHRDVILPLMALIDIVYSRCLIGRLVLDGFSVAPPGALGALRHVIALVVASRVLTNTLLWSQWFSICWAFPAHVAMVANLIKTNHLTCQSAALSGGQVATRVTHGTARTLSVLRFGGLVPPPPAELTPLQECCTVLTYLQLSLALAAPALAMAVHETRLFLAHAEERRRAGLPPERGLHPWLYRRMGSALLGLDWPFAAALVWVLLGVLGALADGLSLGGPAQAPA